MHPPLAVIVIPARTVLMPLGLLCVVLALSGLYRRAALTPARAATVLVFTGYLALVARLTLLPMHLSLGGRSGQPLLEQVNLVPLTTIDPSDFVLNILMTVPFGLLLPLVRRIERASTMAAAGFALSLGIELTQAVTQVLFSAGRRGDVNDLIANTLGAVAGFVLLQLVTASLDGAKSVAAMRLPEAEEARADRTGDGDRVTSVRW